MRRAMSLALSLSLVLGSVGTVSAQQPPLAVFPTETVPCPFPAPAPTEAEGVTYDCGVVIVPENYGQPGSRTIELLYFRLRSTSASPAADPVIYLAGGPGGSGVGEVSGNAQVYQNLNVARSQRDIISYDQRGTGYSGPILCNPYLAALGIAEFEQPSLTPSIEALRGSMQLTFGLCSAGYKEIGVDLGQYNSVNSAYDIQSIARSLGYASNYNLVGTSYGTRLALVAMRETPANVRSVLLDGVSPPDIRGIAATTVKRYEQYRNIFRQCEADASCNAAYPNIEARFVRLLEVLKDRPIVLNPPIDTRFELVAGGGFPKSLDQISVNFFVKLPDVNNLMVAGGFAYAVPRMIMAMEQQDVAYLRNLLSAPAVATSTPALPANEIKPGEARIDPANDYFAKPIEVLLATAASATAHTSERLSDQWTSIAVIDLRNRLLAGESQSQIVRAFLALMLLPTKETDSGELARYSARYLSRAAAVQAEGVSSRMSRTDVRRTFWNLQSIGWTVSGDPSRHVSPGMMLSVHCAEELAYTTRQDAQNFIDALPYPGIQLYGAGVLDENYIQTCKVMPPTKFGPSIVAPVSSSIPALIFNGAIDIQTPLSWGYSQQRTLPNSYMVEWKNLGHVALSKSFDNCAGDIAATFLARPTTAPDISCSRTKAYTNNFELPLRADLIPPLPVQRVPAIAP